MRSALTVSRAQAHDLPRPLLDALLKAPAAPLPAYVGVDLGSEGYAVAKILKVDGRDPVAADPARGQAQYAQALAQAEAEAYYAALKQRFKVQITPLGALGGQRRGQRAGLSRCGGKARCGRFERGSGYNLRLYGGCSSVGRVQDCDSCCRGFEPHQPPQNDSPEIENARCTSGHFFIRA